MIIDSRDLTGYSAYDLLRAAARGYIGLDHRLLHALLDKPDETLPDIVRFAGEGPDVSEDSEEHVSLLGDLISIFHHLKSSAGLPFLINLIREDPSEIEDEIVYAFVAIGQPAVEPLLELYSEVGDENGAEIAFMLAGLGVTDRRILELLLRRLDVDWSDALFHLEVYNQAAAIPFLESRIETTTDDERQLDLRDTIHELQEPKPPVGRL